ncbi:glutamate--tRNA ligase [Thermicanus aegyptius]|uniref:glutamate--tRNA ligase n=1 Tax=Thermicanus aegyptius TaxID=94009 RepID=UPI0004190ED6|nr:glutamate--tRNA ligase [Thermicanus aegyptius]
MANNVRVRYAPSPTGHLHIGGARTALFNYLFAKRYGGKFIIRIEDTDMKRHVADAERSQLDNLRWLGIEWDESVDKDGGYGPYRSMERLHLYQPFLERLLAEGKAYPCFCSEEELLAEREAQRAAGETPRYSGKCSLLSPEERERRMAEGIPYAIRFRVPKGVELSFTDLIRGFVSFRSDDIGDFVIVKQDGAPTYNFAVTIDDMLMEISHVIRGEEHLSNTPRQLLIYRALGAKAPEFAHLPLILNQDRQKMSKRDESIIQFVEQYREMGYLPEAIINFLSLLGWSPEGEREIFSLKELEEIFSIERVSKSPAVFDTDKLAWMNNHYMKEADPALITEQALPHLVKAGYIEEPITEEKRRWVGQLVALYQEKLHYAAEIVPFTKMFFEEPSSWDDEAMEIMNGSGVREVLSSFLRKLEEEKGFTPENVKELLKEVQKETGQKGKNLFMPIRVAATGEVYGPDLNHTLSLLGRENVKKRLLASLSKTK